MQSYRGPDESETRPSVQLPAGIERKRGYKAFSLECNGLQRPLQGNRFRLTGWAAAERI
jgi:hypothetical protein